MNILNLLDTVSWATGSAIVVAVFVAFAITGIFLVRRIFSVQELKVHHDVAGFVFANLGVLYSVLLGFTVVNVQQRFDKIRDTTHVEAGILTQLYRDSEVFSEKNGDAIRKAVKNYTFSVIHDEWPVMSKGRSSPKAVEALDNVWKAYYDLEFNKINQQVWYAESISKLNLLMSSRIERLMGSVESLGPEMWTLLIVGGLLVTSFVWFFGLDRLATHILMASILAAVTAFLLFLIYSLDTSFSGDVNVAPEAFERALNSLN